MAKETNGVPLGIGEDLTFPYTILNATETTAIDITGWALSWMVKRAAADPDGAAILTKTTSAGIVISGVFNAAPATNTQVATVTVADTDTEPLSPGPYVYELKRTDAGAETTLAYGTLTLLQRVHHV